MGKEKCEAVVTISQEEAAELTPAFTTFLEHMEGRMLSPSSVKKRRSCLMRFITFLHEQKVQRWQDVETTIIDAYRRDIRSRGYSEHTAYSFFHTLRLFFEFMEETGTLFDNPTRGMIIARPADRLGLVLTETEIHDLLAVPDLTTPCGIRDRAIIETLYATGIRLGECTGLTIYDLDVDHQAITVLGKGSKQRVIPTGRHAAKYLKLYLKDARKHLLRDQLPPEELWIGKQGARPLKDQSIRVMLQRHALAAGLPQATDTHCLRRTCATHMLRGGAHPIAVAQMLGHSDLSSLAHYLKTNITDLMKTHAESKPGM